MNLAALTFCQGAVARKDFIPSLQFFDIKDGRIKGYNGNIAMSSPIDVGLSCKPKALQFIKTIKACRDPQVAIWVTQGGRLAIKSGGFTGFIDCIPDKDYPEIEPTGEIIKSPGNILEIFNTLQPFIGQDASRVWSRGILFRGQSAYTTNNIILVEKWLGTPFPIEVNIPEGTVDEVIRIWEEPSHIQYDGRSITFHYTGDRWLKSILYGTKWPNVESILTKTSTQIPIPMGMPYALEDLTTFVDDLHRVYFSLNKMSTRPIVTDTGAFFEVEGTPEKGCFNLTQLKLLVKIAQTCDFSMYPDPCLFMGDNLRGAIVGMLEQ